MRREATYGTLTRFVLRRRWLVVIGWLLIAAAGLATLGKATGALSTQFSVPGSAFRTDQAIQQHYHSGGFDNPPVVLTLTPPAGTPAERAASQTPPIFAAASQAVPNARLADQATTGDPHFATKDLDFALVFPASQGEGAPDPGPTLTHSLAKAAPPGWRTGVTGLAQLEAGSSGGSGSGSTLTETLLGGLGALVVLAFVFGSFVALLPLLIAAVSIPTTFLVVYGLTQIVSVNFIVEYLIALIGLGVAVDYSLLIVTRWRENRDQGMDNDDAVVAAMDTAGRAVVFSGATVTISLLALVALPVSFLRSMGIAALFIPAIAVAVAITLLPVLLAIAGPAIDRPRLRREVHASRGWSAWARGVLRHRVAATVAGAVMVAALIAPMFSLNLGDPHSNVLAHGSSAHATLTDLERAEIPSGVLTPIDVLAAPNSASAISAKCGQLPGVYSAFVAPPAGGASLVEVLSTAEPASSAGAQTLATIRKALHGQPGVVGIGGQGATNADFINSVYGAFPLMLGLIALVTLILLTRAFRSVLLAAKAVIFNLASLGVAYGVLVLVWQEGHGSLTLWSIPATGSVVVYVPLLVFAFLFGLSMDYEVFIVSRICEEYGTTGSIDEAVSAGIGRTGRLITSAALILFLAFLSLSAIPETAVKMLATGLGAGILLDALVIRSLLLPPLVGLLGHWNWWLPRPVARVLRIPVVAENP